MLLPRGSVFQFHSVARLYSCLNQRMCWSNLPTHTLLLSSSSNCPVARCKLSSPSQHVTKDMAASPQEKVPFTWPYLLHSLRQAGPQQLLCFLFQLLLKCLLFMSCKIFLSSLCHLLFLFFPSIFTLHCTKLRTVLQNCFSKARGIAEQKLILCFDGTLTKGQICSR